MVDQDKGEYIAEEVTETKRTVRWINPFRQVFPYPEADQWLPAEGSQRAGSSMHARRIGECIDHQPGEETDQKHIVAGNTIGNFQQKVNIKERSDHPQEMNVIQEEHLKQYEYDKIE